MVGGVNPAPPEMGYMSNLFCLLIGGGHVENTYTWYKTGYVTHIWQRNVGISANFGSHHHQC